MHKNFHKVLSTGWGNPIICQFLRAHPETVIIDQFLDPKTDMQKDHLRLGTEF